MAVTDHFGINCGDNSKSQEFYDRALAVLGYLSLMDVNPAIGYGRDGHPAFRIAGGTGMHAPRIWPEYHPGHYGAFVRDPDGNNVEAVFHGAQPAAQVPTDSA